MNIKYIFKLFLNLLTSAYFHNKKSGKVLNIFFFFYIQFLYKKTAQNILYITFYKFSLRLNDDAMTLTLAYIFYIVWYVIWHGRRQHTMEMQICKVSCKKEIQMMDIWKNVLLSCCCYSQVSIKNCIRVEEQHVA